MNKKKAYRIVIVDDEFVAMSYYRRALELDGYDVQHYKSVDDLKSILFDKQTPPIDLFIIDIMLPPGEIYSSQQTDEGVYTGLFLAQDVRKKYTDKPIIILSNTIFRAVREAAKRLSSRLNNCIVMQKVDTKPIELADVVNQYFKKL
jgi:CheY-like chemotaxis protein